MGDHLKLKNNRVFLLAEAAGGVYNGEQMRAIVAVAENESAFLKVTEDQRIGFLVEESNIEGITAQLRSHGILVRGYQQAGTPSPRVCLGELCEHAEQNALDDALELTASLAGAPHVPGELMTLGMNGCARACVGSATDDIHIVAETSGYKVSIGGKARELPALGQFLAENVQKEKLAPLILAVLEVHIQHAEPGERLCDVIERVGLSPFLDRSEAILGGTLEQGADDLEPGAHQAHDAIPESGMEDDDSLSLGAESGVDLDQSQAKELLEDDDLLLDAQPDASLDPLLDASLDAPSLGVGDDSLDMAEIPMDDAIGEMDTMEAGGDEDLGLALGKEDDLGIGEPVTGLADDVLTEEAPVETLSAAGDSPEDETLVGRTLPSVSDSLLGEDGLEIEDATSEDVERVTSAIRSESEMSEHTPVAEVSLLHETSDELGLDPVDGASAPHALEHEEEMELDAPSPLKSAHGGHGIRGAAHAHGHSHGHGTYAEKGGRFKVKIVGEDVCLSLPSGIECKVPVHAVAEGQTIELEFSDGMLLLEGQGESILLRYGPVSISVPLTHEPRAA